MIDEQSELTAVMFERAFGKTEDSLKARRLSYCTVIPVVLYG
jgi:hypothetical protein